MLAVGFITTVPYQPPATAPGAPVQPALVGLPTSTTSTATVVLTLVPGATSYYIFCSGVTDSSQYIWNYTSTTVAITVVRLQIATVYTQVLARGHVPASRGTVCAELGPGGRAGCMLSRGSALQRGWQGYLRCYAVLT